MARIYQIAAVTNIVAFVVGALTPQLQYARAVENLSDTLGGVSNAIGKIGNLDIPRVESLADIEQVLPKKVNLPRGIRTIQNFDISEVGEVSNLGKVISGDRDLPGEGATADATKLLNNLRPLLQGLSRGDVKLPSVSKENDSSSVNVQKALSNLFSQRGKVEEAFGRHFTELAKTSVKKAAAREAESKKAEGGIFDALNFAGLGGSSLPSLDMIQKDGTGGDIVEENLSIGYYPNLPSGLKSLEGIGALNALKNGLGDFGLSGVAEETGKKLRSRTSLGDVQTDGSLSGSDKATPLEGFQAEDDKDKNEGEEEEEAPVIEPRSGLSSFLNPSQAASLLSAGMLGPAVGVADFGRLQAEASKFLSPDRLAASGIGFLGPSAFPAGGAFQKYFDPNNFISEGEFFKVFGPLQGAGAGFFDPTNFTGGFQKFKQLGDAQALATGASALGLGAISPASASVVGSGTKADEIVKGLLLIAELQKAKANQIDGKQFIDIDGINDPNVPRP